MVDEETIRWIRDEARDDGDEAIVRQCNRALDGDAAALVACEETLRTRVARAHRAHRRGARAGELEREDRAAVAQ